LAIDKSGRFRQNEQFWQRSIKMLLARRNLSPKLSQRLIGPCWRSKSHHTDSYAPVFAFGLQPRRLARAGIGKILDLHHYLRM